MLISSQMGKLNPYTARVDRDHPSAFIFLIDQSWSMSSNIYFNGRTQTMAEFVAHSINNTLAELISRCTKQDGIRHYFDISLIGYGSTDDNRSHFIFNPHDTGWVTPEDLSKFADFQEVEEEINIRGKIIRRCESRPYWLKPIAEHNTPMHHAFSKALSLLESWCKSKEGLDCYPPVVINITDGEQNDASNDLMRSVSEKIKETGTIDGNTLIFNIHISAFDTMPCQFPSSVNEVGSNDYSHMLFDMSSTLPKNYVKQIIDKIGPLPQASSYKAMGLNMNTDSFIQLLNIGTVTMSANSDDYE